MMKPLTLFVLCITMLSCSGPTKDQSKPEVSAPAVKPADDAVVILEQAKEDSLKGSLRAKADGQIGDVKISIRYHSPAVRGRIIWGGLVPIDRVWVAGAHMATSVEFSGDVIIGGKPIPAGKYGFFAIPGKEQWTLILNTNWQQHLADEYAEKDDVVRVSVEPEPWATNQERLRYVIESDGPKAGELVLYWEKLEISLPVQVK
jgi:hypothetical protein